MSNQLPLEKTEPPRFQRWWLPAFILVWLGIGLAPKLDCEPGTFGDMFGMVNSLFSGLAFLGLIHTIRLQIHEIGLQRRDLELTRNELQRTADAQTESARALALQVIISSIAAQINTAIQRRVTAMNSERELVQLQQQNAGSVMVNTNHGQRPVAERILECQNAIKDLTGEINRLSERLRRYDELLTSDLAKLDPDTKMPDPLATEG